MIYLTAWPSTIVTFARTNYGPSDDSSWFNSSKLSSFQSDKYAAGTLTGAEMRSTMCEYEYGLFTIYVLVLCKITIVRTLHFKFVSYILNQEQQTNDNKIEKWILETRIRIDHQPKLCETLQLQDGIHRKQEVENYLKTDLRKLNQSQQSKTKRNCRYNNHVKILITKMEETISKFESE